MLDAVEVCKQRCWRVPWVVDLDIQGFFDNVPHAEIVAAVEKHTDLPWVVLYVRRWLVAPIQHSDGSRVSPAKGTPQGSAISPLLSNLFLHYALDSWLARNYSSVRFERYCDDIVLHCHSQRQARFIRHVVEERLLEFGLRCHPEKSRIVYCKQDGRDEEYPDTSFTFLGFDFRRAPIRRRDGVLMCGFVPLVGRAARTSMAREIRQWKLGPQDQSEFPGPCRDGQSHRVGVDQLLWALLQVQVDELSRTADQPLPCEVGDAEIQAIASCQEEDSPEDGRDSVGFSGDVRSLEAWRDAYWFDGGSPVTGDCHAGF
ncbi:MAG: reverse transcriptase domain-containing protein [Pseudonocardiaceae bacterium]